MRNTIRIATAVMMALCSAAPFHNSVAHAQDPAGTPGAAQGSANQSDTGQSNLPTIIDARPFNLQDVPLIGQLFQTNDPNANNLSTLLTTEPLNAADWQDNNSFFWDYPQTPKIRVSPDVRNLSIRDAVKSIIGKADVSFEIDSDVPTDTRVTLRATNISLTTALNVLMESAGIGCKESSKQTLSETNGKQTVSVRAHFHFTKKVTGPIGHGLAPWLFSRPGSVYMKGANGSSWPGIYQFKNGTNWKFDDNFFKQFPLQNNSKSYNLIVPKLKSAPDTKDPILKQDPTGSATTPGYNVNKTPFSLDYSVNSNVPMIYNLTTSEVRSTFTCPHCKQQITVLKKRVAPKCPTCGRVFQDDWKFCPVDGAKRPEESGDWKFCPHCGKAVS